MANRELPVLLIHGFTTNKLSNLPLHRVLRKAKFKTHNVDIPGLNLQNMEKSSQLVADKVEDLLGTYQCEKVQMVGISMGGLIGLHYLRKREGHNNVDKFVTLGTPFSGTPIAKALKFLPINGEFAATQLSSDSDFISDLHDHDHNHDASNITSIGAVGDTLVPEPNFHLAGARNILSPHGQWPVGHYDLVMRKANHDLLISELDLSNPVIR